MKKLLRIFGILIMIIIIFICSNEIIDSIRFSFSLCINNLFPSLIPFMLLSNILINYNFIDDLSSIFESIMIKIFKVNKNTSFAFVMSLLSGTPSNAKYLKDLLDNNLITIEDVKKSIKFIHFTNPIFVIGTIGYTFLNSKKLGLIILISHYLGSIIPGLFNKKGINNISTKNKNIPKDNFINILNKSITSTIDTLLLILGIITTSLIITSIINNFIYINYNYRFIYGFLEITQGLKYLSLSNISLKLKTIISAFLISFGGFSIHLQVFSIINKKEIRYLPYFLSRLISSVISSIICFLLLSF